MARSEPAPRRLQGRVALVTGAASGIGRAVARLLAEDGAAVAIVDVDGPASRAVADEIAGAGGTACSVRADVTNASDCERAVRDTVARFGRLDIVVNNAGIIRRASVVETTEEEWDRVMDANVKSVFLVSKHAMPHLVRGGGGAIVNVSSGWGLVGGRRAASYCASKGAVVLLTKAMALDHASDRVRVNCVCPGDTDTPMLRNEAAQLGRTVDGFLAEAAARPLGRIGRPEDAAQAVLYLVSDASAFVTGTTLVVDGGGLAGG